MLNIAFWIIFGFLTSWIGAILVAASGARTGAILVAGVLGGIVGGACVQVFTEGDVTATYNPTSLFGATLLAVIMVALVSSFSDGERTSSH